MQRYEELLSEKEATLPTHHPKIKIAKVEKLDYIGLISRIDSLLKSEYTLSKQDVVEFLRRSYLSIPAIIANTMGNRSRRL